MPQMAPMWWETLFAFFTMMFMFLLMTIYHMNIKNNIKMMNMSKVLTPQLTWKW